MRSRLFALLILLCAGVSLWLVLSPQPEPPAAPDSSSRPEPAPAPGPSRAPAASPAPPAVPARVEVQESAVLPPPKARVIAAMEELPEAPGPETADVPPISPATVLENLRLVFRQYHARFGGNPVGTNPEITAALNGRNARQAVFLNPEDGLRINGRGQLVDPWDTPYFFHQLSRTEMEIRSAGPDKRMWTPDDLVVR